MKYFSNNNKGFTLIELTIVVALLGILAAIAIPTYLGIQKKSARSEAKSNLQAISVALEGYMAENNSYGRALAYTYWGGSFGHSGNIETVAHLKSGLEYRYTIQVILTPIPAYTIFAVPDPAGRLAGDITFSLDSTGVTVPVKW